MSGSLQVLLDFVWASAGLSLASFSLGLILGELKVVNVAQGDFVMAGTYAMYDMRVLPFPIALAIIFVFCLILGLFHDEYLERKRPSGR